MNRKQRHKQGIHRTIVLLLIGLILAGCQSSPENVVFDRPTYFHPVGTTIDYPELCTPTSFEETPPPHTLTEADFKEYEYWELSLEEVVQYALANSKVMRDLGARVLTSPQGTTTTYDPALVQLNPGFGEEAALSAFDAQFATSLFFDRSERSFSNRVFGGNLDPNAPNFSSVTGNTAAFSSAITKTAATGTQLAVRKTIDYERTSNALNSVASTYETVISAEFRHPLLKGGGIAFNRIAGPNAVPGSYRGILIARINTDIALADFEAQVRNFLFDVYSTYWNLNFAYRNLSAQKKGRDAALEAWRAAFEQLKAGAGDGLNEAQAEQQFLDFQANVQNALSGSPNFIGVFTTERQLRRLMGAPINDGRLIRPSEDPSQAEMRFDWDESLFNAVNRRVELRRQRWTMKQKEMQLLASRNQIQMQLDLVGQYRWRGIGDEFFGERGVENGSAYRDLFTGNLQGWNLGLELSTPIGNRIGHVAVRHAEMDLARERTLLYEQEQEVQKEVSDAFTQLTTSFELTKTRFRQIVTATRRLELQKARYDVGSSTFEFVLEAERVKSDAESAFFGSLVDYNIAIAEVHRSSGTFLDYLGVELSEGAWSPASYSSAMKEARRFKQRESNYCVKVPCRVSAGPHEQHTLPRGESMQGVPTPAGEVAPSPESADAIHRTSVHPMHFPAPPVPIDQNELRAAQLRAAPRIDDSVAPATYQNGAPPLPGTKGAFRGAGY